MMTPTAADRDAGFSLIELLSVIVVLGVLATIVVMSVGGSTDRAAEAARASDERTLATAMESYQARHGYYASEELLVESGYLRAESELWDVVVDEGADRFTLVSTGGSGDADAADPVTTSTSPSTSAPTTVPPTTVAPVATAAPTTVAPTTAAPVTTASPATTVPATDVTCSFVVYDAWDTGGNAWLTIINGSDADITTWTVRIAAEGRTIGLWSASGAIGDGTDLTANDAGWNGTVAAGGSRRVTGGSVSGAGLSDGQEFGCAIVPVVIDTGSVTCTFAVTGRPWSTAANAELTIINDSSTRITNWTVAISTSPTRAVSVRNASTTVGANSVTASSLSWNGVIEVGNFRTTGASITGSGIGAAETLDCTVVGAG